MMKKNSPSKKTQWIVGVHAVKSALTNPRRRSVRLLIEKGAVASFSIPNDLPVDEITREGFRAQFGEDSVHQYVALEAYPLEALCLQDLLEELDQTALILVLDQVTDPHNVGAILRSAAALGASAVLTTERNAPLKETETLAKSASGALELIPYLQETNLARTLTLLKEHGFWIVGLAEGGDSLLTVPLEGRTALVLGSEGKGMRRLTREHCDFIASLPTTEAFSTLNVSNAAAVATYEWRRRLLKAGT